MLISYLSIYLVFIIIASAIISFLVLKLNLPAPRVLIPIIIAVIILPGIAGYLYVTYFTSIPEVAVPDVKGLLLAEAEVALGALELKGIHAGSVYNTEYPGGSVVSQRPESGRRVKAGRIINLITSSGKRRVIVPNLLGRHVEQAKVVLAAKGLLLGTTEADIVFGIDPGIILVQTPLPAEEVETGTFVDITISASGEVEEIKKVDRTRDSGQSSSVPTFVGTTEDKKGGFWPWW